MTHAKILAAALVSASVAGAMPALADERGFGQEGQAILSADRMFGLAFTSTTDEDGGGGGKTTDSNTTIGLLWPGGATPYNVPRVGFDFNVASGFTVGGSIGFVSLTGSEKREQPNGGPSSERDSPTLTVFAFAPRVGYAYAFSDQFAFWPRLGVTYYNIHTESTGTGATPTTSKQTVSGLGLDVEPMFVFSPVSHFGITFGPVLDVPLTGTSSSEVTPNPTGLTNPDDKVKFLNYGIAVGLLGYF